MWMKASLVSLALTAASLANAAEIRINWAPIVAGSATELPQVSAKIYDTIVMDFSGPSKFVSRRWRHFLVHGVCSLTSFFWYSIYSTASFFFRV